MPLTCHCFYILPSVKSVSGLQGMFLLIFLLKGMPGAKLSVFHIVSMLMTCCCAMVTVCFQLRLTKQSKVRHIRTVIIFSFPACVQAVTSNLYGTATSWLDELKLQETVLTTGRREQFMQ